MSFARDLAQHARGERDLACMPYLLSMSGLKWKWAMADATQKAMGPLCMSAALMAWSCRNSSMRPLQKLAYACSPLLATGRSKTTWNDLMRGLLMA